MYTCACIYKAASILVYWAALHLYIIGVHERISEVCSGGGIEGESAG